MSNNLLVQSAFPIVVFGAVALSIVMSLIFLFTRGSTYDEIGEGLPEGANFPRPDELADQRAEIEQTDLFTDTAVRHFDWEVTYNADEYIRLLDTFSGHIAMARWKRDRLYSEIRHRLAQRPDGRLRRHWGAVLHVARRA